MNIYELRQYRRENFTPEQNAKFLPVMVDEYNCPPVDPILYNRSADFKSGIVTGYLKKEFWELEHDDPHKAPREIRIAYVKAEIEKLCDQHDVTVFEAIAALRLT